MYLASNRQRACVSTAMLIATIVCYITYMKWPIDEEQQLLKLYAEFEKMHEEGHLAQLEKLVESKERLLAVDQVHVLVGGREIEMG